MSLPMARPGDLARPGDRVTVTAQGVTATGTVVSRSRHLQVRLDGTGTMVWVDPALIGRA